MNTNNKIRIIGDSHGLNHKFPTRPYLAKEAEGRTLVKLLAESEYSIQLGDIGWRDDLDMMRTKPADKFKIVYGNHDDYDNVLPHSLGDYGSTSLNGIQFSFIRGEESVDKQYRSHFGPNKTWWVQEELDHHQAIACMKFFDEIKTKPTLILSHGCPSFLLSQVVTNKWKLNPSLTSQLLSSITHSVKPALWIFGHHHTNQVIKYYETTFICLNELCYVDLTQEENTYTLTGDIECTVSV